MDVIICGRNDHSRYIAQQYYKNNMLKKYYTLYYPKNNLFYRILKSRNPNIDHNKRVEIDESLVKNNIMHFIISKIFKIIFFFLPNRDIICNVVTDTFYDLYISFTIEEADIYHLWSQYSYFTIKNIKKRYPNAKIMIDVFAAHPTYREAIYNKYPIIKKRKLATDVMIKKINKELILADQIIVASQHTKNSLLETLNIPDYKIEIIYYGIQEIAERINNTTRKKIDKNELIKLLYVGRVSDTKGINYLLDAMDNLTEKFENIELNIVGHIEEDFKEYLHNHISDKHNINIIGPIPHNELDKYYTSAHAFVFPSLSEGSGMVISEAMSVGLPVITTRNANWIIENNVNGIVIKEHSVEEIVKMVEKIILDDNLREKIAINSLRDAKKYTWDFYMKEITKVITNLN